MPKRRIAVIGIGKIALDEHLPAIARSEDFELAATVSSRGVKWGDTPTFRAPSELYAAMPNVRLVAICSPPGARHALVREALDAGCDVLMEKPPVPTIAELEDLKVRADAGGRVLFQTWHSRFNDAVERARDILARNGLGSLRIDWREDVRKWHPGQDWVWEPDGFGVCDPGINALSILTRILPFPVFVESAKLAIPSNRRAPIDVEVAFKSDQARQPEMTAGFSWLESSGEMWTIAMRTGKGDDVKVEKGGAVLRVNGEIVLNRPNLEYERIYQYFATLLDRRQSDVDEAPLQLIADIFLVGEKFDADPFEWHGRPAGPANSR